MSSIMTQHRFSENVEISVRQLSETKFLPYNNICVVKEDPHKIYAIQKTHPVLLELLARKCHFVK